MINFAKNAMSLKKCLETIYIIRYKEDIDQLKAAFYDEGFDSIKVLQVSHSDEELSYSHLRRCLISHNKVWSEISNQESEKYSLVVEADFVPVEGIADLPMPIPEEKFGSGWSSIYSSSHRVYEMVGNYIRGHSGTGVAYIIDKNAAKALMAFAESEFEKYDPREFTLWDTYFRYHIQEKGIYNYLPMRSYGEHGGFKKSYTINSIKNRMHHADILYNKLKFMPGYGRNSKSIYYYTRFIAWTRAILRTTSFNYVEIDSIKSKNIKDKIRLLLLAYGRLLPFKYK